MATLSRYSDSRLLELIEKNDQQALGTIFERYWAQLFDYVHARVSSVDSSRSIVQEIFITLWLQRRYLSTHSLQEYLYADAYTRSIEYLAESVKEITEEPVLS